MEFINKYKKFLVPAFLAFLIASFYIVINPGQVKSDAKEYDDLANSILLGKYEIAGAPSMEREPGYPALRAMLKTIDTNPNFILWVQAILYFFTVFLIGLSMDKIDHTKSHFAAWGAGLAYGLAFYPSVHLTETLVAFLLSIIGFFFVSGIDNPKLKDYVFVSIFSGILILTKYTYVLIPISLLSIFTIISVNKKASVKNLLIGVLIVFGFVFPWVVRNYQTFHEINVAGRSGAILYARAWKADKPWASLGESYISVFMGRGLLFNYFPNNQSIWLDQWGDWWRDKETVKKLWGEEPVQADKNRKAAAFKIIFKDFNNIAKFTVWSGVDELRLLELPNPMPQSLGSPIEGTYGPAAKSEKLSIIKIIALVIAHLVQLAWFIGIPLSTWFGFKKYGFKFIPSILLICILIPHSIADNIPRYGAPLQPWLLSASFMTLIYPLYNKIKSRKINVTHNHNPRIQ